MSELHKGDGFIEYRADGSCWEIRPSPAADFEIPSAERTTAQDIRKDGELFQRRPGRRRRTARQVVSQQLRDLDRGDPPQETQSGELSTDTRKPTKPAKPQSATSRARWLLGARLGQRHVRFEYGAGDP